MNQPKGSDNTILIIDDDRHVLESLVKLLKNSRYRCITAMNAADGIRLFAKDKPLVILTDMRMEEETSGLTVLEEAKRIDLDAVVILYTAFGSVPNAVEAFKKGAFDYIEKVRTHVDILQPIDRAIKFAKIQRENAYLRNQLDLTDDSMFYGAVGVSPIMHALFEKAKRVSLTNATVLITGETGVGKEVLARGIHFHSQRRDDSFVPVAVSALPETLLEAELFGHVKGAFTGATMEKPGLFETADKGSLFLDEIGEVSADLQHKLLRVLEDRKVRRIGSLKEREIDVRFLSATNCNVDQLLAEKKMREDLYYRLRVIQLHIPPLRDRREDIPVLVHHFLKKFRHYGPVEVEGISSEALLLLQQFDWPGNVRELQHAIEYMITMAQKPELTADTLPEDIRPRSHHVFVSTPEELDFKESKAKIVEEFERHYIEGLLQKFNGNITKVAEAAGLNRKTIYRLMEARGIPLDRSHGDEDSDNGK
ncbi:sigma-54-dependent Fis family transcriptional regulator [candidate division KSB1 bacterium]|nr:sigma-54-dependent Fis family transcriptional regulator [candidate division KSB1 bacterium]